MSQTNFQKLDVYKLAERLADEIWDIVIKWDALAKDMVGKQIISFPVASELLAAKMRRRQCRVPKMFFG